jgi:hypothetical protein
MTGFWMLVIAGAVIVWLMRDRDRSTADAAVNSVRLHTADQRIEHLLQDKARDNEIESSPLPVAPPARWLRVESPTSGS